MRRAITSAFTVLGSFLSSVPFDVHAQAAAVHAASCSAADTEMAMGATRDGDIVVIPSCPAGVSWPSTMTVTKGITIQGAGIGRTVLLDGVFKGNALCAGGGPMLRFLVASPKTWRLSGLTVRGSAPNTAVCQSGHVHVSHTTKAWRIDHVRIENQQTVGIRVTGDTWGLIDHAQFQGVHENGVIVVTPAFRSRRSVLVYRTVLRPAGIEVHCVPVVGTYRPDNWTSSWHGIQDVTEQFIKLQYYRFYVLPLGGRLRRSAPESRTALEVPSRHPRIS